jgi:hypothetical protein
MTRVEDHVPHGGTYERLDGQCHRNGHSWAAHAERAPQELATLPELSLGARLTATPIQAAQRRTRGALWRDVAAISLWRRLAEASSNGGRGGCGEDDDGD